MSIYLLVSFFLLPHTSLFISTLWPNSGSKNSGNKVMLKYQMFEKIPYSQMPVEKGEDFFFFLIFSPTSIFTQHNCSPSDLHWWQSVLAWTRRRSLILHSPATGTSLSSSTSKASFCHLAFSSSGLNGIESPLWYLETAVHKPLKQENKEQWHTGLTKRTPTHTQECNLTSESLIVGFLFP